MSPPVSPPAEPPSPPSETVCLGSLGLVTLQHVRVPQGQQCSLNGSDVRGNVLVEPGASLFLGAHVRGNVEVKPGATAAVFQATIGGNLKCDRCRVAAALNLEVGGNLQIIGSTGDFLVNRAEIAGNLEIVGAVRNVVGFFVTESSIAGNMKLEKNVAPMSIHLNSIGGDLQIVGNELGATTCDGPVCSPQQHVVRGNTVEGNMQVFGNKGPSEISSNTVRASLQCAKNRPAPVVLFNVARASEGQCAVP